MSKIPPLPRWLGLSGLLPQLACVLAVWFGPPEWRFTALAIGWGYAALIFSFLGGLWWGLAAAESSAGRDVPSWLWAVSVLPSLWALVTYIPWIVGANWPGPSLLGLALAIFASLLVDRWIAKEISSAPAWWMSLRIPLSAGLGLLSILLALG